MTYRTMAMEVSMRSLKVLIASVALFCTSPALSETLQDRLYGDWCSINDSTIIDMTLREKAFVSWWGACDVKNTYKPEEGNGAYAYSFDLLCNVTDMEAYQNIHLKVVWTHSPSGDEVVYYSVWPPSKTITELFPRFSVTTKCAKGVASGN